jgi:hypothetical protein
MSALLALIPYTVPASAQSLEPGLSASSASAPGDELASAQSLVSSTDSATLGSSSFSANALPDAPDFAFSAAPEPAEGAANPQREGVPWAAVWHQQRFSRIGIGADVSLLGIGIKATTPLDDYIDVRGLFNFFSYHQPRLEVDGFNIYGSLHLASVAAAADFYPKNSVWRLSGGLFLYNGNQVNVSTNVVGGTSFSLDGTTYYSSTANPASGTVALNLNTLKAAPMFSFGFGRFVPHSNRHWSFPTEFGAIYMGTPSLVVTTAGDVCTDKAQTQCSSISDQTTPVGQAFNSSLNAELTKWRSTLKQINFYPIFSYSVVYSFNIR